MPTSVNVCVLVSQGRQIGIVLATPEKVFETLEKVKDEDWIEFETVEHRRLFLSHDEAKSITAIVEAEGQIMTATEQQLMAGVRPEPGIIPISGRPS